MRIRSLEVYEKLNDAPTIRSSVNIIAKEHVSHRTAGGVVAAATNEFGELVHTPVHVANAIYDGHIN